VNHHYLVLFLITDLNRINAIINRKPADIEIIKKQELSHIKHIIVLFTFVQVTLSLLTLQSVTHLVRRKMWF